ncbi:Hypothetical protein, putative, partial [Bodo saltans]
HCHGPLAGFAACSMALVPPADAIFRFFSRSTPPRSPVFIGVVAFHSKPPSPFLSLHRFVCSREVTTSRFKKESSAAEKNNNNNNNKRNHAKNKIFPPTTVLWREKKEMQEPHTTDELQNEQKTQTNWKNAKHFKQPPNETENQTNNQDKHAS